jgi:phosphatidylserine/phosphatidylglycerophosphate/cardiolipin synthase-like enzyme
VITDLNPAIFHQKFIVRDPGEPTAAVLTGSTNFTLTDTGTNPPGNTTKTGNNLNHIVVLHGQSAATQYLAEFTRLRTGTFGDLHERHEPRPSEFSLAKIRIKPVFAPDQGPEMEIMKQMLKAKTSIDFAMFTFAQSSGIDDTMIRLVTQITRLRGVLDRGQGVQQWAATQPLKAAGVQLFENKPGTGVRKVHHKLMVIDERLVIAGSFNYTAPAATLNDENILILGDLEEPTPPPKPHNAKSPPTPSPRSTASSPTSATPYDHRTDPAYQRCAGEGHGSRHVPHLTGQDRADLDRVARSAPPRVRLSPRTAAPRDRERHPSARPRVATYPQLHRSCPQSDGSRWSILDNRIER